MKTAMSLSMPTRLSAAAEERDLRFKFRRAERARREGGGKAGPREVFGVRRHGSGVSSVLGFWGLGGGSVGGCAEVSRGGAAGQLCIWLFVIINKAIGPRAEPPPPPVFLSPLFYTRPLAALVLVSS